ncbi:OmpA-OmpF porin, OOP family [Poseidonocella pacifica]|uniref:OmpA-OmpF porin, OOP family n=1 Tax=Poseidonocella pacifica TaxID=871651 RepID=A0A1I0Y112_9RHOB|nr:OmpA family protein [Poseidonocella pacifica]SFB06168.1 OmpA-OmpF porin, OOP family [Poseidonocella pacifica]
MMHRLALVLIFLGGATAALDLPAGAELVEEVRRSPGSYMLPTGTAKNGVVPTEPVDGNILRQVWQLPRAQTALLPLLRGIEAQLGAEGYETIFDCAATACGGFDFRFGIEVARPPDMIVNLRTFRFLAMRNTSMRSAATLLVSRTPERLYLQIVTVSPPDDPSQAIEVAENPETPAPGGDVIALLRRNGHVVLSDLVFESGGTQLGEGKLRSLETLAGYLNQDPVRRIALVGHTDSVGSIDANTALSRRRAEAVRARLLQRYDVAAEQVTARGVGLLSPYASNATPEGREQNRRVEAVLLAGE